VAGKTRDALRYLETFLHTKQQQQQQQLIIREIIFEEFQRV